MRARVRNQKACALRAGLLHFAMLAAVAWPSVAHADGPLTARGTPIHTSDYTLDLFQGPVLASSRVTAMGGAYAGLAEGAEGIPFNAAAASQRNAYSTTTTDWELNASLTFPGSVANTDFDNNGHVGFGYDNFVFATLGGFLQHDNFGLGGNVSLQNYSLGTPRQFDLAAADVKALTVRIFKVDAVASYGFFDGQLHIGGGIRGAIFNAVDTSAGDRLLFGTYGIGAQGGVLWRPLSLPLRVGATIRSPVIGTIDAAPNVARNPQTGDRQVGHFYLPKGVDLPWEAEWGVAVQIGPRPLNVGWTDEEHYADAEVYEQQRMLPGDRREPPRLEPRSASAHRILRKHYRLLPREKLLLSTSVLVTGPTPGAVGVESMLSQVVERSGERTSVTLRGGGEVEAIPNRLQLRGGTYMEPTRFRGSTARAHATAGFEIRLIEWSLFGLFPEDNSFRISGAVDVAREYFGWSLGVGSWY
jgi:hypothetical protein